MSRSSFLICDISDILDVVVHAQCQPVGQQLFHHSLGSPVTKMSSLANKLKTTKSRGIYEGIYMHYPVCIDVFSINDFILILASSTYTFSLNLLNATLNF